MNESNYTLSDIAAVTGNNGRENGMFGGNFGEWILVFLIFAIFGNGWGGGFGGFGGSGAMENYVLGSDFSMLSRQLSDGFNSQERKLDSITNGLCDGFYTEAQLVNGVNMNIMQGNNALATQIADCCCKTQSGIERVNTGIAMASGDIQYAIKDCCCENEKIAMQNRFDMAQYNCNTLQAIDKLGDRILGYISDSEKRSLENEVSTLRLAASQAAQTNAITNGIIDRLSPCPRPAYVVPNPNCCYGGAYGYGTACGG